jgi:hypothetical protein
MRYDTNLCYFSHTSLFISHVRGCILYLWKLCNHFVLLLHFFIDKLKLFISLDQERKNCLGARLTSGQDILCQQLILDPSYKVPILDAPSDGSDSNLLRKVARGICIISKSLKQDSSNLLIVFPPKCKNWYSLPVCAIFLWCSNVYLFWHDSLSSFSIRRAADCSYTGSSVEQQSSSMPSWNVSYLFYHHIIQHCQF